MKILTSMLDDYVDEDNPVRFMDAFVDSLNLSKLGFKRAEPSETQRPQYDPADLLKLYVYGYLNQVRSSGKLERMPQEHRGHVADEDADSRLQDHRRFQEGQH